MGDILNFHAMNLDGRQPIPSEIMLVDSLDSEDTDVADDEDINEGFEDADDELDDELDDDEDM